MDTLISLFIADAHAAAAPAAAGPGPDFLLMMIALFALMYFMLIRPQAKRAKEHRLMVEALQKGDEVVTMGGIVGRVTAFSDQYVTVEITKSVEVKVERQGIQRVLPKGTLKNI